MMRCSVFYISFCLIQCAMMCGVHAAKPLIAPAENNAADQSYQALMKNARARLLQFIEKETYQLTGFDELATIPITFPIDICLMELNDILYAPCLHVETLANENGNHTMFKLFKQVPSENPLNNYELIFSLSVDDAVGMDCGTLAGMGFVIVVKTIDSRTEDPNDIENASPIIQIKDEQATVVQYFAMSQQNTAHFQRAGNGMYLLQTFHSDITNMRQCPIYKWSETTFNEIDSLPCTNAMRAEAFILDHEVYVAFANHMDEFNNAETFSVIFKFDLQNRKFNLLQKIKTFGATDIKYFQLNSTHKIEHFLIVANTFASTALVTANAIIYEFNGEKFIPFQILNFDAPIKQFLPVTSKSGGFVLLIALENQVSKSFQYDGHNFVETKIKFTGGSFGRGVSSLRTYQLDHEEVIVVANSEMLRDATNLFRPKYTMKIVRDIGNAISRFDGWYDRVKQKLRGDRLEDLFDEIEGLRAPTDINVGKVSLQRCQVQTIQTDEVKSTTFAAKKKVLTASMQVADELFTRDVLSSVKTALSAADQAFSASTTVPMHVIDELIIVENVNVLQSINGRRIEDFIVIDKDLTLDTLCVDQLIVDDPKNMAEIQAKLAPLTFSSRKRRDVDSGVSSPLRVNHLFVMGRLNGIDFSDLQEYVLRTNAVEQQVNANVRIDVASANVVSVRSNVVSNQNLADLVSIKANSTLIEQDIRFIQPIVINELNIMNRLNHINVINNRFDALFRRAKGAQTISGNKLFESITLLEPILQQGKIDIRSPILEQIKPMVNIDRDIELHGDYSISGNVTIQNLLAASNLFGRSGRYSAKELQEDALRIDETTVDVPMEFAQPIKVENVVAATRFNGIPISTFIKRSVNDIQTITGKKMFAGDLHVKSGLCDAYIINGVDLLELNRTVLKNSAENQVVSGSIHFSRILADNIRYRSLRFGNRPIEQLLTRSTDQIITGNITIYGNVLVANNTGISIRHISTKNDVFGVALDSLLDDCVEHIATEPIHLTGVKWINQMYIGHLVVETDFWQTNKPDGPERSTNAIQILYESLQNGVTMDGDNIILNNQFTIDQMTVTDAINGMPAESFGLEWLLIEGDQTFSVAQSFANVIIEDDIILTGYINGYNLPTLFHETMWKNTLQRVELKNVAFENVIVEGAVQLNGRWTGLRLPDDIVMRNSTQVQNVNALVCEGSIRIFGELLIQDTLNRHNYSRMCDLIAESEYSPHGLIVEGDATFKSDPSIDYVNGQSLTELLASTWFVNDEFVFFDADNIQFKQVALQQSITLTGKVNGQDLNDLNARYLSLTKSQQIHTLLQFQNNVHFKKPVTVTSGNVSLYGELIVNESIDKLNLSYFRENVLKKSPGTQIISGQWKFADVKIKSSLRSTLINNLNFNNDIVRFSRPEMNIIRATKIFDELFIKSFVCQDGCAVNDVNLGEWIARAVLLNNNYTIQGTTYLRNPVISHVDALGTVNNITFQADRILLNHQRQRIYRNVNIGNPANPLRKLTFENIYLNYLNGQNFTDFQSSLVQRPSAMQRPIAANVASNMQFEEPLTIENLECFGQVNGINFSELTAMNYNRLSELYRAMIPELRTVEDTFVGEARAKIFDRMALRQILVANTVQKMYKLNDMRRKNEDELFAVLIQESDAKRVQFYAWSDDAKRLTPAEEYSLILPNEPIIDLSVVALDSMELIVVQTRLNNDFTQSFYHSNGSGFDKVYHIEALNRLSIEPAPFTIGDHDCILIHNYENATSFDILSVKTFQEMPKDLQMLNFDTQQVGQMKQLIAGNGEILVVLGMDDLLTIIDYKSDQKKIARTIHNASEVAARTFERMVFIAVSIVAENQSAYAIEIYRYSRDKLGLMQTLEVHGIVVQCGFAHMASNELILLVQMADASINFYKYHGIVGFQMVHEIKINGARDASRSSFSLAEDRRGDLQLLIISTGLEIGIVELIFH